MFKVKIIYAVMLHASEAQNEIPIMYIILHTKPPVARPVKTVNQQSNEYIKTRKTSASATMRGLHNIDILMSHENSSNRRKFHFIVGMSNVFQPVLASLA